MNKTLGTILVIVVLSAIVALFFRNTTVLQQSPIGSMTGVLQQNKKHTISRETKTYTIDVEMALTGIPVIDTVVIGAVDELVASFEGQYDVSKFTEQEFVDFGFADGRKYSLTVRGGFSSDADLYSYRTDISEFTGGAHGNPSVVTKVFRADGQIRDLASFFVPNADYLSKLATIVPQKAQQALCSIITEYSSEDAKTADECSAEITGMVADGTSAVAENYQTFQITEDGIRFIFQAYQVAPYVFGQPEVEVSWAELGDIVAR